MSRQTIQTSNAPQAIGPYSQAVRAGDTVYLSGQIPLDPATMQLVTGDMDVQARRVFDNLKAVAEAAGGSLGQAVKLTIFLAVATMAIAVPGGILLATMRMSGSRILSALATAFSRRCFASSSVCPFAGSSIAAAAISCRR